MDDKDGKRVLFAGDELATMSERVDAVQAGMRVIATTLRDKLHDPGIEAVEVRSLVSGGIKTLIVHTADGHCYVYDGDAGVCRFCTASEEG